MSRSNKPSKYTPNHPYFKYRWYYKRGPKKDRHEVSVKYRAKCKDAIRNGKEPPVWRRDTGWYYW